MHLSRFLLGLALACFALPALAQSPDAMRFAGTYKTTYGGTFGNQTCTVRLTASTTIFGGYGASSQGCGGSLMSLSRWNISGFNIVLMDGNGAMLASLGPGRNGLSGGTSDGAGVRMTRTGGSASSMGIIPPGANLNITPPGFDTSSGCRVYYGWNGTQCAPDIDLNAPVTLPGAIINVMALSTINMRQGPSFSNGVVAKIPVNSCVRAEACGTYGDTGWCRVQYNGQMGWIAKQQTASNGRRYTLFTNRCGTR